MPIYEYKCPSCDHRFSVLQRMSEGNENVECELCGTPRPVKQFSTFASANSSSGGGSFAASSASSKSPFT